jgi:CubicO group peptidase (beta-lactamase class C family)
MHVSLSHYEDVLCSTAQNAGTVPTRCDLDHVCASLQVAPAKRPDKAIRIALAAASVLAAVGLGACTDTFAPTPGTVVDLSSPWHEVTPDQVAMDGAALEAAAAEAAAIPRFRTLLVARWGGLVLERYFGGAGPGTLNDVRSVTKSVVSTLAGIAQARGLLPSLDTTIAAYLAADYRLDTTDSAVTVQDLLTMSSGYQWNETAAQYDQWRTAVSDHVQLVLDLPSAAPPGTTFAYNTPAVHMLGVLLQHATGMTLPDFAERYLFAPIGIHAVRWEPLDPGTVNGGAGIALQARDLLRLGQLFLQQGRSGSRQMVPADWVALATRPYFSWRTTFGPVGDLTYGYLWWVSDALVNGAFFAWGYGGQFIYLVPALDLVVVATTDWSGIADDAAANALEAAVLDVIVNGVIPAAR